MIKALSYMFAVILTLAIAIVLYPIAGIFWILGLFGKIADALFGFTKKVLSSIWREIREMSSTGSNTNPNQMNNQSSNQNPVQNSNQKPNQFYNQTNHPNNISKDMTGDANFSATSWKCSCGAINTGYFCRECGKKKS